MYIEEVGGGGLLFFFFQEAHRRVQVFLVLHARILFEFLFLVCLGVYKSVAKHVLQQKAKEPTQKE